MPATRAILPIAAWPGAAGPGAATHRRLRTARLPLGFRSPHA